MIYCLFLSAPNKTLPQAHVTSFISEMSPSVRDIFDVIEQELCASDVVWIYLTRAAQSLKSDNEYSIQYRWRNVLCGF